MPFIPLKNPKSKFWKMETFAGDIITLDMCTKNHNHMMYSSWDTEWDRQKFLSFWIIFCPFTSPSAPPSPLMILNIKILKKIGKKTWRYYHFTNINDSDMMYGSWDMDCNGQNFLSFWTIFCPFTPPNNRKSQNSKKWKNHQEILSFYTCVP